jgi:hypothetical protein
MALLDSSDTPAGAYAPRGFEFGFDDEAAEPSSWFGIVILAVASTLACLPAAIAIAGPNAPGPVAVGLGVFGFLLAGLKVVCLLYGTRQMLEDGFPQ